MEIATDPMKLAELPRLKGVLDLMGLDNGADVIATAPIPADWEMRARLAEDELLQLSASQVETLAMGECFEMEAVARLAPNAAEILEASFDDGPLAELFFTPWRSIYDAHDAEQRVRKES